MDGFVVKKDSVRGFAVLSEGLSMIGHDGDQRTFVEAEGVQLSQQFSDGGIDVGDLPVVGFGRVLRLVGFGRIVGIMRVVEVDP